MKGYSINAFLMLALVAMNFCFSGITAFAEGTWEIIRQADWETNFYDVVFVDADTGWAVGAEGMIAHTTDGGTNWEPQDSHTKTWLFGTDFINSDEGWAVGYGDILYTSDGGINWEKLAWINSEMQGLDFVNSEEGWVVGHDWDKNSAAIYHTEDGGNSWQMQFDVGTSSSWFYDVQFIDENIGWTVGYDWDTPNLGIVYHTQDGGKNWTPKDISAESYLYGVWFINEQEGWVVGSKILHTEDGGNNWTVQSDEGGRTFYFADTENGWVVGWDGRILHTSNGGDNWTQQDSGTVNYLSGVYFADNLKGCVVGHAGVILRTEDGGSNWIAQTDGTAYHLYGTQLANSLEGWAVGDYGAILHSEDSGDTWEFQDSGISDWLIDVSFINSEEGWAISPWGGIILHTVNGGETWELLGVTTAQTVIPLPDMSFIRSRGEPSAELNWQRNILLFPRPKNITTNGIENSYLEGIHFVNSLEGWAVGHDWDENSGAIYYTNDGGNSWETQLLVGADSSWFYDVYFVDADNGWAVGYDWNTPNFGIVYHTADGGDNWTEQEIGVRSYLYGVHFVNPALGWVVGSEDTILHTNDSGETWRIQNSGGSWLYDVFFVDVNTGWAVGDNGTILHTSNGGITWAREKTDVENSLSAIHYSEGYAWTVGGWGIVLRSAVMTHAPTVTLLSPNGGEIWSDVQDITWEATDPDEDPLLIDIVYSPDAGITWKLLAMVEENDGVYRWDTRRVPNGINYLIKVFAFDGVLSGSDQSDDIFNISNMPISQQPGWPVHTEAYIASSPVLGDIDRDGELEIIVGSQDNSIYALNPDGTFVRGWPVRRGSGYDSSPALGDIDGDGWLDVAIGTNDVSVRVVNAWGEDLPGWPQRVTSGFDPNSSPALSDIDGDGYLEVIAGDGAGNVYAWNGDGTLLDGWPVSTGGSVFSSAALGDIDDDGKLEVVVGSKDGNVYAWNGDGTLLDGWPVSTGGGVDSSPALGDIDNDGKLEIVVGSDDGNVYAFKGDGTPAAGNWPFSTGGAVNSSPALGDIDGDGELEIAVGSEDWNVYVLDSDGILLNGWPVSPEAAIITSSPILGDIDGDGELEIVIGINHSGPDENQFQAFNSDGTVVDGWPLGAGGAVKSSPVMGDIDNDGALEIVVGSDDGNIYCWDMGSGTYNPDLLPWQMFRHDMHRTGAFPTQITPPPKTLFTNVSDFAGIDPSGRSGRRGVAFGDYNDDDWLDIYASNGNALYKNNKDGTFTDVTAETQTWSGGEGVCWGDYDNDYDLDLYATDWFSGDTFYRNEGNGTFTDVTDIAGLRDPRHGSGTAWADYDNDGDLDLYVSNMEGEANALYRNDGNDLFTDVTEEASVGDTQSSRSQAWVDYDNDGDLDLYVANFGANRLYDNKGDGTFVDMAPILGITNEDRGGGSGPAWGDYDNDSDLDLAISSGGTACLYRNDGNTFTDVTDSSGVSSAGIGGEGLAWGDYDNDGWLDMFVTSHKGSVLYHNNGDGTFTDETISAGVNSGATSFGTAWGDYDNDGDLDLYVVRSDESGGNPFDVLYRNDTKNDNHWLIFKLEGVKSNWSGIGARVKVIAGTLSQIREVSGGSGRASQDSLPVEFGLGEYTQADIVQIRWPSGVVQTLTDVEANQVITVVEEVIPHYGDVSLNDEVTAHDASLVLRHVVGLIQLSSIQRKNADVTADGTISALDAAMILQHSVGLIEKFPAEGEASPTIADINHRTFALSVADVIAKVGQQATVPISLNDSNGVFAGKFELAYDSKLLKVIDVSMAEQTAKYSLVHNALPDRINVSFAGSESFKEGGVIVNVTFEVLPTVTSDAVIPLILADAIINENSRVTIKHGSIAFSPTQTALHQNYPNPFNPDTWIPYQLAEDASVTINIYNIRGQLVRKLYFGKKQAGYYVDRSKAAHWDGRNAVSERVANGVYFYTLRAGDFQAIRKMIIIK